MLASPGSGSSEMVSLLNSKTDCEITGENTAMFINLARVMESFMGTDLARRDDQHSKDAWRRVYERGSVKKALQEVVRATLNPNGKKCWGFKEIRYGLGGDSRLSA